MSLTAVNLFGTPMVEVTNEREIPLGGLDTRLRGVVGLTQEPVMVGNSGGRAAVMGLMPHGADADNEVEAFVKTLLEHDRIDFSGTARPRRAGMVAAPDGEKTKATHAIATSGGKKVLTRVRFLCETGCRCSLHLNR